MKLEETVKNVLKYIVSLNCQARSRRPKNEAADQTNIDLP